MGQKQHYRFLGGVVLSALAGGLWLSEVRAGTSGSAPSGNAQGGGSPVQSIGIPCIQAEAGSQKAKDLAKAPEHIGQRVCADVLKDFVPQFNQWIGKQAECFYQGVDLDQAKVKPEERDKCVGTPVVRETCNALDNGVPATFNQQLETDTNHLGFSCGNWPYFKAKIKGTHCKVTPTYLGREPLIEDAYNRGAWIQALNCYHQQVKNEIQKGTLTVSTIAMPDGTQADGPCQKMAGALKEIEGRATQTAMDMRERFGKEANIQDIENCTGKEVANGATGNPGRLRQSACQLRAARASNEAMFIQLGVCEVFTRAQRSYEKFLGNPLNKNEIAAEVRKVLDGRKGGKSECKHERLLKVYQPRFMNALQTRANKIWSAEACQ